MKRLLLVAGLTASAAAALPPGPPPGPPPPYQMRGAQPAGDRLKPGGDGQVLFQVHCGYCHLLGGMGSNLLTKQRMMMGETPDKGLLVNRTDLTAAEKAERTAHYLNLVGLSDFADAFPKRISGGMRQRVAIARSLASGSEILLMDEPFGALDAQTREFLQEQLLEIQRREAKTVIFVTHDVEEAVFLADRIVVFSARPARVLEVVDVNAAIGTERTVETKETEAFFRLRNHVLHLIRDQTRRLPPELTEAHS